MLISVKFALSGLQKKRRRFSACGGGIPLIQSDPRLRRSTVIRSTCQRSMQPLHFPNELYVTGSHARDGARTPEPAYKQIKIRAAMTMRAAGTPLLIPGAISS